ncbi:MAG: TolC family protein [Chloroherpetonaceae bacterium]|nr:TolC family protein [Chloroherpetonaceae bacterium]MDW8438570.1 TolC family protein [Chloroherpetonaceae bacterium]
MRDATVAFLALLFSFSLSAQPRALSLNDAVTLALQNNRDLIAARLDRDKSAEGVRQAYGLAMPNVALGFVYGHSFRQTQFFPTNLFPTGGANRPSGAGGAGFAAIQLSNINSYTASVTLQQPLFRPQIFTAIGVASAIKKLSEQSYQASRAETIADVKKAYYDVLIAQEQTKLIAQSVARGEQALNDARLLYKQGLAADIDTLRAFVNVENLRPALVKAQSLVEIAKTLLKAKIGLGASDDFVLTDSLAYDGNPPVLSFETAYAEALDNRPEIQQLKLQIDVAEAQIDAEMANFLPTLDAQAQYQRLTLANNFRFDQYSWGTNLAVGLQLSIPLSIPFVTGNFMQTSAKVQQAKLEKKKAETLFDNVRENVRAEVKNALAALEETVKRLQVQATTVQSAERSYAITRLRRAQGVGSALELTDAELALTQAKNNYLQAVYDYLVAKINLERSLGRTAKLYADFPTKR